MSEPSFADFIIEAARNTRISRYPAIASYTALLYEFLLVLDQEYRLIYKSQWSLLKCLYLACRFTPILLWPVNIYTFMNEHTRQECKPLVVYLSLSFAPLLALPQCVYVLRAWAITGRKLPLLALFSACLGGYLAVVLWASTDDLSVGETGFDLFGKSGCFRPAYRNQNPFARSIFAGLALDVIVGIIMLICYYFTIRRSKGRLGRLVLKQDLVFFPLMLLFNTVTAVIFMSPVRFLDSVFFTLVIVSSNILACRFILQIREVSWASRKPELSRLSLLIRQDLGNAEDLLDQSSTGVSSVPMSILRPGGSNYPETPNV